MFLTCSPSRAISDSCPSRLAQPAEAGIRPRGSPRRRRPARSHPGTFELASTEESIANGPPGRVVGGGGEVEGRRDHPTGGRFLISAPGADRRRRPARGGAGPPRSLQRKVRDPTVLPETVWTLSNSDESSISRPAPGARGKTRRPLLPFRRQRRHRRARRIPAKAGTRSFLPVPGPRPSPEGRRRVHFVHFVRFRTPRRRSASGSRSAPRPSFPSPAAR
jgi:hypothetical protein